MDISVGLTVIFAGEEWEINLGMGYPEVERWHLRRKIPGLGRVFSGLNLRGSPV